MNVPRIHVPHPRSASSSRPSRRKRLVLLAVGGALGGLVSLAAYLYPRVSWLPVGGRNRFQFDPEPSGAVPNRSGSFDRPGNVPAGSAVPRQRTGGGWGDMD